MCYIFFSLFVLFPVFVYGHNIDYTAEHIIEGPMNARYLLFPTAPQDSAQTEKRISIGGIHIKADQYSSNVLMLGSQYYLPTGEDSGWMFSGFLDYSNIGGQNGAAESDPYYLKNPAFTSPIDINISNIKGWSYHLGLTVARVYRPSAHWALQYGVAVETVNVRNFQVDFLTTNQPSNFSGVINYAGVYNMVTPFFSAGYRFSEESWEKNFIAKFIVTNPLPKGGFKGSFVGGGTNQSSDSYATGYGKHIPDPYAGLGFVIEDQKTGWQIDVGASLFFLFSEGAFYHKGLGNPIFVNMSFPF